MEKSPSIKEIASALIIFHKHIGKISKDSTNPFFKKKYCSLPNILDAIKEPLQEAGLCFSQHPQGKDELETLLIHAASGEYMQSSYNISPIKMDPQSVGSAITYARRYALGAILGLTIDEDDDANAATKPEAKQQGVKVNGNGTELPWLNEGTKEFDGAIQKIKAGKSSMEAVKKFFKVSKEIENKINEATKQAA
jgi:hypothetical protein